MKTKLIIFCIAVIHLFGCGTAPKYLPKANQINTNSKGSYIKLRNAKHNLIKGELIVIDSSRMIVLLENENYCVEIQKKEISKFILQFAQSKSYLWTLPVLILPSFSLGVYGGISIIAGLLTSFYTMESAYKEVTYTQRDINLEYLKMFARFPQGLPPNLSLRDIR